MIYLSQTKLQLVTAVSWLTEMLDLVLVLPPLSTAGSSQ